MQRAVRETSGTTFRHRFALTSTPWAKTTGGPSPRSKIRILPPGTSISRRSPSSGARQ